MPENISFPKILAILGVIILVTGFFQFNSLFAPTPLSEFWEKGRWPDFQIWINDLTFDLTTRRVEYKIDMRVWTSIKEENGFYFRFSPTFSSVIHLNYSKNGAGYTYQSSPQEVTDEAIGLSEPYPYDSYSIRFQFSTYSENRLDFPEKFVPYIIVLMAYPNNLGWQAQGIAEPIKEEQRDNGFLYTLGATITIGRIPGYSLPVFLPVLSATLVLGSSVFLDVKKNKKEKDLTNRLSLYISLFVFAPIFMYVVGPQVQTRWLMSAPEMLWAALILNVAVFLSFSIVSTFSSDPRKWDTYAVFFSIISSLLFAVLTPIFYSLYWSMTYPPGYGGVYVGTIFSWFFDARIFLWLILVISLYFLPYLMKHHGFRHHFLTIFSIGALIFFLSSFQKLYDPSLIVVSLGYVVFAVSAWARDRYQHR